ncbi:MAG: DUF4097 family beta strand repeat-containing protein [Micromonosporaceae bacterium]
MYEFDCPAPVHVLTRLGAGSLEITAEPRETATVEVTPYDETDAGREAAARTRVDLRDGRLTVEAPEGWLLRRSPRLRVALRVPLDCTLHVKVASADTNCRGRYADAVVNTASGDVYVEHVTGDVSANTASGDLRFVEVGGQLRVNMASGDITAQAVGGELTIHSASGEVAVEQIAAGARVTTASGDVRIGAARRGVVRITCASGDVSVGVTEGTGVWLDLVTMSGKTRSDLSVTPAAPATGRPGLTVQVRTASGDIDVHRVTQPAAAPAGG